MAKFKDPTGNGVIYLNQNYHGESTVAIDKQCAIDIAMKANEYFHSVCDGIVELTTSSENGYISIIPTDMSARVLYVHTNRWLVKKGDTVKAGQKLGQIQDITGCHLHLGMKNKDNSKNPPQIMDYFDRSLVFKTTYQDIANDWFKGKVGGDINWSLFKDLQYGVIESSEDPQVTELKKQIDTLNASIESYKTSEKSLKAQIATLTTENSTLKKEKNSVQAELEEVTNNFQELQNRYDVLSVEKNRIENEKNELTLQLQNNGLKNADVAELLTELWRRIFKKDSI